MKSSFSRNNEKSSFNRGCRLAAYRIQATKNELLTKLLKMFWRLWKIPDNVWSGTLATENSCKALWKNLKLISPWLICCEVCKTFRNSYFLETSIDGSENWNGNSTFLEHRWPHLDEWIRNLEMLRAEIFRWSVSNSLTHFIPLVSFDTPWKRCFQGVSKKASSLKWFKRRSCYRIARKEKTELYITKNEVLSQTS